MVLLDRVDRAGVQTVMTVDSMDTTELQTLVVVAVEHGLIRTQL